MISLLVFEIFIFVVFVLATVQASTWIFETALMPMTFSIAGCLVMPIILWRDILFYCRKRKRADPDDDVGSRGEESQEPFTVALRRGFLLLGSILIIYLSANLVGFQVVLPVSAILYMRLIGGPKTRWRDMAVIVIILLIMIFVVYDRLIHVPWPTPLVSKLFP